MQHTDPAAVSDWQSEYTESFSDTEHAVMTLLIDGLSVREIARKTVHSEFVIRSAMASVQHKTRSKNIVNAAVKLVRSGALTI